MRVLAALLLAAIAHGADVRGVTWGMMEAEVRAAEGRNPSEATADTLRYSTTDFAAADGSIVYTFDHGRLVRASYLFTPEHAEPNEFISDFHAVAAKLRAELGQPEEEQNIWLDDSLQNERIAYLEQDRALPSGILPSDKQAGLAIALGHLRMTATWNKPRTRIFHTMTGADRKIRHQIEFSSVEKFSGE
jgi:hypothetical protein